MCEWSGKLEDNWWVDILDMRNEVQYCLNPDETPVYVDEDRDESDFEVLFRQETEEEPCISIDRRRTEKNKPNLFRTSSQNLLRSLKSWVNYL